MYTVPPNGVDSWTVGPGCFGKDLQVIGGNFTKNTHGYKINKLDFPVD